jgi:hypothetical protein
MTTRRLAEQCGLYEAALGIVAGRAASALALPAGEQARELDAIRAYAAGVLARGATADQGQASPPIERTGS